ncbi:MAG: OmpA family protein [Spirochaetota bacterium]
MKNLLIVLILASLAAIFPISAEEEVYPYYTFEEYDALQKQRRELDSKLQKCESDAKELRSQIGTLQQSSGDNEKKLSAKLAAYEKQIRELSSNNQTIKKGYTTREKKIIAKCKGIINKCRVKLNALRKENAALKSEITTLQNINEEQKRQIERMNNQFLELEKKLEKEIQAGLIRLKKTRTRLTINLDEKISFSSGSTVLKSSAKPALKKIVSILAKYPQNLIYVEGHTDNIPMRSIRIKDNWQLSTERALSVLRYILKQKVIKPERISASGYGEFKPIAPNDTSENRALNRRVDLVVTIP